MKYFVSYFYTKGVAGAVGMGNLEISRDKPISCITDIQEISDFIKEQHEYMQSVTVLNWRKFEDPL